MKRFLEYTVAMRTLVSCLILSAFVAISGCDKTADSDAKPAPSSETKRSEKPIAPAEGKFSIAELKVTASQSTYQEKEAPKPEVVKARLEEALYASGAFEKNGGRELKGSLMYDVRKEGAGWDVTLFGGLASPNARLEAGDEFKSSDERWQGKPLETMVDALTDAVAQKLVDRATVIGADVDGLIATLSSTESTDDERLTAIQEIRERRADKAIPLLRKHLDATYRSELRTAAAATLVQLGDKESGSQIITVAEDLSRERDPQYVPMLHILADLGGQEVVTYLEAVAEGHAAPAVREVASEALRTARGGGQ